MATVTGFRKGTMALEVVGREHHRSRSCRRVLRLFREMTGQRPGGRLTVREGMSQLRQGVEIIIIMCRSRQGGTGIGVLEAPKSDNGSGSRHRIHAGTQTRTRGHRRRMTEAGHALEMVVRGNESVRRMQGEGGERKGTPAKGSAISRRRRHRPEERPMTHMLRWVCHGMRAMRLFAVRIVSCACDSIRIR